MRKSLLTFSFLLSTAFNLFAQQFIWTRHDTTTFSSSPIYENGVISRRSIGGVHAAWLKQFALSYNSRLYGSYGLNGVDSTGVVSLDHLLGPKVSIGSLDELSNGELLVVGTFIDSLFLDGNLLLTTNNTSQFDYHSYILCIGQNGSLKWSRDFTASYSDVTEPCRFAEDPGGRLWVSLDDYPAGGHLLCLSVNGTDSIQRSWPVEIPFVSDMDFGSDGALYLTGAIGQDNFTFWSLPVVTNHSYNAFVAKVDPIGSGIWFRSIRDITFDKPKIEVDANSNVFLVKDLFDSVTVYGNHVAGPQWVYDFLVVKFDSSGIVDWAIDVPDQPTITGDLRLSFADPFSITPDGFNLLLSNRGHVDLGNSVVVGSGVPGSAPGMIILHYDEQGVPQWHLDATCTFGIYPQQIVSQNDGGYVAAIASGPLQIGPDTIQMSANFSYYAFVSRFDDPLSTGIASPKPVASAFPFVNPSTDGRLIIKLPAGRHVLEAMDFMGKSMIHTEIDSREEFTSIDTRLPAGCYLLRIDGQSIVKWMVCP